jgi:hypothetical protein
VLPASLMAINPVVDRKAASGCVQNLGVVLSDSGRHLTCSGFGNNKRITPELSCIYAKRSWPNGGLLIRVIVAQQL